MPGSSLVRTVAHCFRTIVPVVVDLIRLAILTVHSRRALAAENLFLRKQLALSQERPVKPRLANDSTQLDDGNPESHVPVARCAGECQSVNAHPLASPRIPAVLALEVQTHGTTTPAKGPTTPDPRDGCGERHLGRGTHCQRTEAEARNPGLTPHRGELSARRRSGAHARSQAALADLHPQPCQGHCGL